MQVLRFLEAETQVDKARHLCGLAKVYMRLPPPEHTIMPSANINSEDFEHPSFQLN